MSDNVTFTVQIVDDLSDGGSETDASIEAVRFCVTGLSVALIKLPIAYTVP